MLTRKPIFPGVIELNFQAGEVLGCNVYLVFDRDEWLLIDIGYEETVDDFVEIIRQLDFPLSRCKTLIATHADVDHIQGLAKAKQILKTSVTAHPNAQTTRRRRHADHVGRDHGAGPEDGDAEGKDRNASQRWRRGHGG